MQDLLATQRYPGINTYPYIWSSPAHESVEALMQRGYGEFELLIHPPHLSLDRGTEVFRALRKLIGSGDARVHSLNLPSLDTNLASVFSDMRAYSQGIFRKALELCSSLEVPYLITVPGRVSPLFPPDPVVTEELMRRSIEALLPDAERLGVKLAVENVPFASFPDADRLVEFVKSVASPYLAITYDVANAHFIGENPVDGLNKVADFLAVVHMSDTTQRAWRHDPIGVGNLPFNEVCRTLDDICWSGPVFLEIISGDAETGLTVSHDALARLGFPEFKGA